MNFARFVIAPLLAAVLLFAVAGIYYAPVATAGQKERAANPKKPAKFHYVCPMHEDVTSRKRGTCPKCKMKLERKPIVDQPQKGPETQTP